MKNRTRYAARRRRGGILGLSVCAMVLTGAGVPSAAGGAPAATAAAGAAPANVPSSVNPGRVPGQVQPPSAPALAPEMRFEAPEEQQLPPEQARRIAFRLSSVELTGSTVYPAGAFAKLYEARKGQTVTLLEVYGWANAITEQYRRDGYILSRAVVPAQRISGGAVHIAVIEGYVARVKFKGPATPALQAYGEKLTQSRPLRAEDLERYLLLANDLPGATVSSVLAPSPDQPGGADLTLVVARKKFDASVEISDPGTRYIGPWQQSVGFALNDALGHDERLGFRYVGTPSWRELNLFDLNGSLPLGAEGTSLSVDASRTRGRPGYLLAQFDPRTKANSIAIAVEHPVIRTREENLTVGLSFSYEDALTDLLTLGLDHFPSSDDKIRALRLSASYNLLDRWRGSDFVSAELSQGLPMLGSSRDNRPNPSRTDGEAEFTKLLVSASRLQSLWSHYAVLLAFSGQLSAQSLLSPEQFGVGGSQFGRGYDPSEITGDNGVAGKIEAQDNLQFMLGQPRQAQLYVFYDIGTVDNRLNVPGEPGSASLASAGLGARLNLEDGISSSLELAKPLTRPVAADLHNNGDPIAISGGSKGVRLLFSLLAAF